MNIGKNPKNHITYVCELEGCNNIKTMFRSTYELRHNHFCGQSCASKGKRGKLKEEVTKVSKKVLVKLAFDKYFEGVGYDK